jgi:hypothetical protein
MLFALSGWAVAVFMFAMWAIERFNWGAEVRRVGDAALKRLEQDFQNK